MREIAIDSHDLAQYARAARDSLTVAQTLAWDRRRSGPAAQAAAARLVRAARHQLNAAEAALRRAV